MGEVVRFIPKSERERVRLIREARAIYDSIFPPNEPIIEPEETPAGRPVGGADVRRRDGILLP